jgi:hypothetical protein
MRLIKIDPEYNCHFPRAVVPYKRIYGIEQPRVIEPLANDGSLSPDLPEGTPFGLVGTSSLYKRESYPEGGVPEGSVTATFVGQRDRDGFRGLDPLNTSENGASLNWFNQGSDAGLYSNEDIHAIRILAMEPTTDRHRGANAGRRFHSHAMERLRILGEIPVRKFASPVADAASIGASRRAAFQAAKAGRMPALRDGQPIDPDGNPDTSFLAKIPADTAFTFQTLDRNGMVLNMAQTWHQLRPGEVRHDCGGCHAHSQQPTNFADTAAARPDYKVFDLSGKTPLLTAKENDESRRRWDTGDATGLKYADSGVVNVEYHRHIRPILQRSCAACHTAKDGKTPAGNLNFDADDETVDVPHVGKFPGTYYRLALDSQAKFGHKPVIHNGTWRQTNASRYIRKFQSRRSLLVWKVYGRRLDGWTNDDFPTARTPGDPDTLMHHGEPIENTRTNRNRSDLDYRGSAMPPEKAVAAGKVAPLSDEDRRTLTRWIDLGCPIDLDYDAGNPDRTGYGWMLDDKRPTLAVTHPKPGAKTIDRILLSAFDYGSRLDESTLSITANIPLGGIPAGKNLASHFTPLPGNRWEWKLERPISERGEISLLVSIKDQQGNITQLQISQTGTSTN